MSEEEKIEKIYVTDKYEKFSFFGENRPIYRSHVENLKQSFKKNDKNRLNPIIVDINFRIIDGQHRFIASRELNLPIYYMIDDNFKKEDLINLNVITKIWRASDYLAYYVECNYPEYEKAKHLIEKHKTKVYNVLCVDGHGSKDELIEFKNGSFSFKNYEKTDWILEQVNEFSNLISDKQSRGLANTVRLHKSFLRACKTLFNLDSFDVNEFFNKYMQSPYKIIQQAYSQDYMELFINIYNYKRKSNKISKLISGKQVKYLIV